MNDILRTFRLGTINLLGVTIPGLMFLILLCFGCIAPGILAVSSWMNLEISFTTLPPIGQVQPTALVAGILVVAYVAGYIFRLSTPDDLDKQSAKVVLERMRKEAKSDDVPEKDHWPYRGDKNDKFPYFHFKDYLDHRKRPDLAEHVKWNEQVRSKTFVNAMKLETALRSPPLSASIESNEAHVRLMFGTWLACRFTMPFIVLGFVLAATRIPAACYWGGPALSPTPQPAFLLWTVITGLLLIGNYGAKRRIENLFHNRRVRELFDIVECYDLARKAFDLGGRPQHKSNEPPVTNADSVQSEV